MLTILSLALVAPFAAAKVNYKVPTMLLQESSCIYPEGFEVAGLRTWLPVQGNNKSSTVDFSYRDNSTSIHTACHLNSTSVNVGRPGLAPRYACNDPTVEFIWQNETLTLIEKACPQSNSSTSFEAAGSIKPALVCSDAILVSDPGQNCWAPGIVAANFTSLEPSPRQTPQRRRRANGY